MLYYVYLTTNLINERQYVGDRETLNIETDQKISKTLKERKRKTNLIFICQLL